MHLGTHNVVRVFVIAFAVILLIATTASRTITVTVKANTTVQPNDCESTVHRPTLEEFLQGLVHCSMLVVIMGMRLTTRKVFTVLEHSMDLI